MLFKAYTNPLSINSRVCPIYKSYSSGNGRRPIFLQSSVGWLTSLTGPCPIKKFKREII